MKIEIDYGTLYIADTEARTVHIKSNGVRVTAGKRVGKVLRLADEPARSSK